MKFNQLGGVFLLFFSLSLASCSWWGGDDANKESNRSPLEVKAGPTVAAAETCFTEVDDFFARFFRGLSTRIDISFSIGCMEKSIDELFKNMREVNHEKGFTRHELLVLFKAVWGKKNIVEIERNIDLLLYFKRLFVGGPQDQFSRKEWAQVRKVFPQIVRILGDANPYIKYWFYDFEDDYALRETSFSNIEMLMKDLDKLRAVNGGELTRSEATSLIKIIFDFDRLEPYKEVALTAHALAYGEKDIYPTTEKDFFTRIHQMLEVQARFRAVRFPKSMFLGDGLKDLFVGIDKLTSWLLSWSEEEPKFFIPIERVSVLFEDLYGLGFLNEEVKDPLPLSKTLRVILKKIFDVGREETDDVAPSIDHEGFIKLRRMMLVWLKAQRRVIQIYKPKGVDVDFFSEFSLSLLHGQGRARDILNQLTPDLGYVYYISSDGTLKRRFADEEAYSHLSADEKYYDLSLKLLTSHLIYMIFTVYYPGGQEEANKVKAREMKLLGDPVDEFFLDLRTVGVELGMTNPLACNAGHYALFEANIFTLQGNGDSVFNFREGAEWLGMMLVAGSASLSIYSRIEEKCALPGDALYGSRFADRKCAQRVLFDHERTLLRHFPDFSDYYGLVEREPVRHDWENRNSALSEWYMEFPEINESNIQSSILSLMNKCVSDEMPLSRLELQSIVGMLGYVETIFYLYDRSGTWGVFSSSETSSDFILDSGEIAELFKDRVGAAIKDNASKDSGLQTLTNWYSGEYWIDGYQTLDTWITLDRLHMLSVLGRLMTATRGGAATHPYVKNFCDKVISSYARDGVVSYDKDKFLKCDGTDPKVEEKKPDPEIQSRFKKPQPGDRLRPQGLIIPPRREPLF